MKRRTLLAVCGSVSMIAVAGCGNPDDDQDDEDGGAYG